jgi:hypothetical protein
MNEEINLVNHLSCLSTELKNFSFPLNWNVGEVKKRLFSRNKTMSIDEEFSHIGIRPQQRFCSTSEAS